MTFNVHRVFFRNCATGVLAHQRKQNLRLNFGSRNTPTGLRVLQAPSMWRRRRNHPLAARDIGMKKVHAANELLEPQIMQPILCMENVGQFQKSVRFIGAAIY